MEIVFTTVLSTQNWVLSLYSPVDPGLCPIELLTLPRSGGILVEPEINSQLVDFTPTADVTLLSWWAHHKENRCTSSRVFIHTHSYAFIVPAASLELNTRGYVSCLVLFIACGPSCYGDSSSTRSCTAVLHSTRLTAAVLHSTRHTASSAALL